MLLLYELSCILPDGFSGHIKKVIIIIFLLEAMHYPTYGYDLRQIFKKISVVFSHSKAKGDFRLRLDIAQLRRRMLSVYPYFILQLTSGQLSSHPGSFSVGQRAKRDSLPFKRNGYDKHHSGRVRIHVFDDRSTHTSIHPRTRSSSERAREITITMKIDLLKIRIKEGGRKRHCSKARRGVDNYGGIVLRSHCAKETCVNNSVGYNNRGWAWTAL